MNIIRTNQLKDNIDNIVQLNGWVYNSRCSGKIGFLMFRDGFSIIQCIISVNDVPRTKNGKLVELAVKNTIEGNKIKNKEALANPEVLEQFKNLKELTY